MTAAVQTDEIVFLGSRARVLAQTEDFGLVDMIEVPQGYMPPLHVHHTHDEGFYVLDGEVTLFMPNVETTLRQGEFFLAPRGVPHAYRVGERPARLLVTSTPGGFERFVSEVAERDVEDPAELTAVAARYDIEILGPPGMLP